MSSPTSALSSVGSSSSTTTPTYFTGMSSYGQDLNNAISRELQIAQLPIQLLQNNVNDLTNQQNELDTLNTDVTAVQTDISTLASAAGSTMTANVADPSVASVTVGATATVGTYSLEVNNLGSYSDALSIDGLPTVTNPATQNISTSGSYTLSVTTGASGTPVTTPISFSGGNLNVLAQAINESGAGVQATIVDVGTSAAPAYRLSLQSDQLGPVTMQLNDGTQNLLETIGSPGVLASYSLNGQPLSSTSDTVTLAPGLTAQLTGESTGATTVTVAADPTAIGNALQSFVTDYNTAMTELDNNRGQTDVALAGESIVYQLTDALQSIANYTGGTGGIASLAQLGVQFPDEDNAPLAYSSSKFAAATSGQSSALTAFLGSPTGGGFLQMATNTMTGLLDPTSGTLSQQLSSVQANISSVNAQIATKDTAVTQLQNNLTQQMAAADTMIYDLEQQDTEIQDMFTAEQDSLMGQASGL